MSTNIFQQLALEEVALERTTTKFYDIFERAAAIQTDISIPPSLSLRCSDLGARLRRST